MRFAIGEVAIVVGTCPCWQEWHDRECVIIGYYHGDLNFNLCGVHLIYVIEIQGVDRPVHAGDPHLRKKSTGEEKILELFTATSPSDEPVQPRRPEEVHNSGGETTVSSQSRKFVDGSASCLRTKEI